MRALPIVVLALAAAVAGCLGTFRYDYLVEPESEEAGRSALDAQGQANCVAEALVGSETAACPLETTGSDHPAVGILVLDAFYATTAGPSQPVPLAEAVGGYDPTDPNAGRPDQLAHDALRGMNLARASGGIAPDVIPPGPGQFVALLGWWNNLDDDATIDVRTNAETDEQGQPRWNTSNEWIPVVDASPIGFLEPGSRPVATSTMRPGPHEPDFELAFIASASAYATGTAPILFADGSLAQTFRSIVVSKSHPVPAAGTGLPFTPLPGARVDIDDYAAIAPGPVAALYASSLAPAMNDVGSPSVGSCPDGCEVQRAPTTGTPADAVTTLAAGALWSPYPREWDHGQGGSGAGRVEDYRAAYHDWIDLLPKTKVMYDETPPARDTAPLVGGQRGGAPTMAPGLFTAEVRVGLFHDHDGDGFVGSAGPDPYESGRRPLPDDYARSNGEYLPLTPRLPNPGFDGFTFFFNVTLVPHDTWGAGVVLATWHQPVDRALGRDRDDACYEPTMAPACADASRAIVTGREPVTLQLGAVIGSPGFFATDRSILMPEGSPGFTVCTEPLHLAWTTADGEARDAWVRDCDRIARWTPAP